ncbi:nucleotidyltransferase domain-containing protein [Candidatus Woesearchaeota archaeon]|nr:nucleotidyltransferase domain-containing protein [Candidatus Woesearchaeota archaeon]
MLISYASSFATFLISNLKDMAGIQRIVLFGSAARNEETTDSDVDIFIETKHPTKASEKKLRALLQQFYESREAALFKVKGISNKINVKIGNIEGWKDLYQSFAATGIVLYGPYEARHLPSGVRQYLLISWEKARKNRGAFLNKLYGFTAGKHHYTGSVEKLGGKRVGKSCILIPLEHGKEIYAILEKYKAHAKAETLYGESLKN